MTVLLTGHVLDSAFKMSLRERFRSCHSDSNMCETQKCSQFTMSKPIWKFFTLKKDCCLNWPSVFFFFFQSYFTDVDRNLQTDSSSVKLFKADTFSIIFDLHNILASFASFEGMLTRKFRLALLFLLGRCRLCTGNMKSQVVERATNI